MSTEKILRERSGDQCELCAATDDLSIYAVEPSDGSSNQSILICANCKGQIEDADTIQANHWRCLNDSMWSQEPPVQVMAWRQLKTLTGKGETWAQDLNDMLYLDDDMQKWAEQGLADADREPSRDCNGAILKAGDNVTLAKDLDVKGAGFTAKRGTLVKNISLCDNPEHIEGRVNGTRVVLVAAYMKKA